MQNKILAKNPIQNHLIGYPCMLEKLVCRIIGEADGCLWGEINGNRVPSIIKICTPHGTVITTGRFYVDEISVDGLKRLMDYESALIDSGKEVYGGYLNDILEELNIVPKKSDSKSEPTSEENHAGSQQIIMTETEKSFMNEIDSFLYWSGGNVNVLEIFRKHKKMPD